MSLDWKAQQSDIRTRFDRDGFVQLSSFFSESEVGEVLENLERFIRDRVPSLPPEHAFYEDKADRRTLKQLQNLHGYDSFFGKLTVGGGFEDLATALLGDRAVAQNLQYFNKPAGIGKGTPAHQDGYYFMLEPCLAVTMWLALEEVDAENGCVRYIPGSHKRCIRPHQRTTTLGFSQGIADWSDADEAATVSCPANPGDLLVHHAMTIHRADGNQSKTRSRQALGFVYFGESAKADEKAKAAYVQKLTREMKAAGKI
ncbi:MAG: phytanoyl-CoA dioxygenase [Verrucomicrobiales bacterium]|nr:phytanoyl-CoA dioxygenase [Verrucomicrobiales bacterium]